MVARAFSGRSRPSVKKGGGGAVIQTLRYRMGVQSPKKNFVWTFRSQFGVKIRGGGCPGPSPGSTAGMA